MKKYQSFLSENFQFLEMKFSIYLIRRVFVMIVSDPGALADGRSYITLTVSEKVWNSSSIRLHSTCGSLLIAPSLIDDCRIRTPSTCTAYLFKIASLSVRRLVPFALRSWVVPELCVPYTVLSTKNSFRSFLSAKDWISSAFLLSKEYCMSLSLIWTVLHMFE